MEIEKIIEQKNLKLTSARRELLELFIQEKKPVSFDELKHKLKMDKATFYRNVSIFEKEAIVNSFESNDKKRYYEFQKSPHAHFICNICNTIECLKDVEPINIPGYKIVDMIFKGDCKSCNK